MADDPEACLDPKELKYTGPPPIDSKQKLQIGVDMGINQGCSFLWILIVLIIFFVNGSKDCGNSRMVVLVTCLIKVGFVIPVQIQSQLLPIYGIASKARGRFF